MGVFLLNNKIVCNLAKKSYELVTRKVKNVYE